MCLKMLFELVKDRIEERQVSKLKDELGQLKRITPLEAELAEAQIETMSLEERIANNKRKVTLAQTGGQVNEST